MRSKNAYLQPTQLWWGKISRHNLLLFVISQGLQQGEPGRCGRVVSTSTCQAGGLWFKSGILPLLKHTCGESDQLLCWLYTLAEVSHQRWISGNVNHVHLCQVRIRQNPLWLWNPEDTSPEVWNRGISGPKNGHVSNKNFKKKGLQQGLWVWNVHNRAADTKFGFYLCKYFVLSISLLYMGTI